MRSHARVVVVGGGCVGAGILYALAERGWTDAVLIERTQLTSGSTWHAAGLIPSFTRNFNIGRMIRKSLAIYGDLDRKSGHAIGWHECGTLRVANTPDRMDEFVDYMSVAETQGIAAELVSPSRIHELWPLLDEDSPMLGGLYHPHDGHIAPSDLTHAMAQSARSRGATVLLDTEVIGFQAKPNGEWRVKTSKGDIDCQHVISATGNYARQTAAMAGLDLPAIPIVHQYWVTEAVPEIAHRRSRKLPEMPILRHEAVAGYIRQEGDALLFGPYERPERLDLFAVDGVPESFGADLLPEDLGAVEDNWKAAVELVPALQRAGIRKNVRGPFQMTADELPLVGPAWGLSNFWLAEGVPGGILWGGAIGHYLSEWIIEGKPSIDTWDIDPRRFGAYANKRWTMERVREAWGTHADVRFPDQEMRTARPGKTSPCYDRLTQLGAVWGSLNGYEVANWFAPPGMKAEDGHSFRAPNYLDRIGQEAAAVRSGVALIEMAAMTKFEVSGPDARAWLDGILANKLPAPGRIALCHHLTTAGTVFAEYTVTHLPEGVFYLVSTPRAQRYNFDTLSRLLPKGGRVTLRDATAERGAFTVVGPRSRDLLRSLVDLDLTSATFPWLSARVSAVGTVSDVRLLRINYSGELGWELYCPIAYQRSLLEHLLSAGAGAGLPVGLVGFRALEPLRLEKSYRAMFRDMNTELTALESGIDRFIDVDKGEFSGRDALMTQESRGLRRRIVTLRIKSGTGRITASEGVYRGGQLVGRVTSGTYSHHFGHDIALALLKVEEASEGADLEVPVLGQRRATEVIPESPYDPKNVRLRM